MQDEIKGDYWEKVLFMYSQKRGKIFITNQRIHVRVGFATEFDIEMKDIAEIKKCNVSLFIPTGIDVRLKNGKTHRLSVLKRDERMETIQRFI